jgi:hypothetical protein
MAEKKPPISRARTTAGTYGIAATKTQQIKLKAPLIT